MAFIIQKIKKQEDSPIKQAIKYYSLMCEVNDIKITRREIELLAFTSIRGTISSLSAKEEFSKQFGSSTASVNNMISRLSGMGLLEKVGGKYRVNTQINIDFESKDVVLQIQIIKKPANEHT